MSVWRAVTSRIVNSGRHKAIIVGLDGVPYSLLQQFIKEGSMPNLAQIVAEGTLCQMDTSIPDVSSVAWTTLFTGVNPAKHGIYGFMDHRPSSYEMYFPNSEDIRAKTLWQILGEHGRRSVVVNVPSTYPARALNGTLISGFVAIDLAKATYPSSVLPMLKRSNYQLDVDATKAMESLDAFAENLVTVLDAREKVLWEFLVNHEWDFFLGVITETDRMHHYLWAAVEDPKHQYHDFCRSVYTRLDRFLGKAYEWFRGKGVFMIMSDHGFCRIQKQVYLNNWLISEGYLRFLTARPRSYADIEGESRAFNMDPARIYLHVEDKYSRGCVSRGEEYESIRQDLKCRLLDFKVDGSPVVEKVFFKEELYYGPLLERAPDMLVLPRWGFDLKGSIAKEDLTGSSLLTGMHTQNDAAFFINVKGLKKEKGERLHITHVAPTTVRATGIEVDGAFDSSSLI